MISRYKMVFLLVGLLSVAGLLASCSSEGGDQPTPTSMGQERTAEVTQTSATATTPPTPTTPPRRLTVCLAEEPETLFIYGGDSAAQRNVLQAVYDGPIDQVGYEYQPVMLEKLPSLADGDALIAPVLVNAGDLIVDSNGELIRLQSGDVVRPYGCSSADCAVTWDGAPLELPQLSVNFTLKPDIKWSDSQALTADDSVFSYQLATQCEAEVGGCGGLGTSNRSGWEMLPRTASYSTIDERTVRWTGVPGYMDPNYQANFFIPLPEHKLGQNAFLDLLTAPEASRQPLSWGPYMLQSWVSGESITLRANPLYHGSLESEVQFDELLFRFIGEQPEVGDLITSGRCDVVDQDASRSALERSLDEMQQKQASGELQAHFAAGPVWEHADFGIQPIAYDDGYLPGADRPDFFSDVRVRQAFALCMEREKIAAELLDGLSAVPGSYLPPEHPLYPTDLAPYPYDPQTGGQLLNEAGWVDFDADPLTPRQALGIQGVLDGTPLVVTYSTSTAKLRREASEVLAKSLAECGIEVNLNTGPAEEVYAPGPEGVIFGRRFDLAQFAWSASDQSACQLWTGRQVPGDPNLVDDEGNALFPYGWGGVNAGGFRDSEYDRLCDAAINALPGEPGYVETHQAMQSYFASQLPVVPLYQQVSLALSRADMCGFSLDPASISDLWNIENFNHGSGCQ